MTTDKLKVVYGDSLLNEPKKPKDYNNKSKFTFASHQFLQGELENMNGFDLFYWEGNQPDEGIFPVFVVTRPGTPRQEGSYGIAFIWKDKSNLFHGLIVKIDDEKSYSYALRKYTEKADCL